MHTTLITTAQLAGNLSDPAWLVADCRFELGKPDAGRDAWRAGHIPGAIHVDLERDLSAPVTATTGRHPLPPIADFAATLSRIGVTESTQVVCYDGSGGAYAARLWWMLHYVGHAGVAVLASPRVSRSVGRGRHSRRGPCRGRSAAAHDL